MPDGLDWKAFNGEIKRHGVVLAGGQGKLTGKIFRLGHLGSVTLEEILGAISTLEFASIAAGPAGRAGSAVAAAQVAAPGVARRRRSGGRRGRRVRVLVAEPVAAEGIALLRDRTRRRRAAAACRATSCARSCPTTTR